MRCTLHRIAAIALALVLMFGTAACGPDIASPAAIATSVPEARQAEPRPTAAGTPSSPQEWPKPQAGGASVPLDWPPSLIATGADLLWIASKEAQTVTRIDPATQLPVGEPTRIGEAITDLVADDQGIWVAGDTRITHLDPATGKVVATLSLAEEYGRAPFRMAIGDNAVWVVDLIQDPAGSGVYQIDPQTNQFVGERIRVGLEALAIAYGAGSVWTGNHDDQTVSRVDLKQRAVVATINVPFEPHYIEYSADAVWVADLHNRAIVRIDPQTNRTGAPISVPFEPEWMAPVAGGLWVVPNPWRNNGDDRVLKIDATTQEIVDIIAVGGTPMDAVLAAGALWITVQQPNKLVRVPL